MVATHSVSPLSGQVAVVTGANRGVGQEIAVSLARAGACVAITARRPQTLSDTRSAIDAFGVVALPVECDVADETSSAYMAKTVLEHFGRADIVIANAGVAGPTK